MKMRVPCLAACLVLAGCGSGSSPPSVPSIKAARTYRLANFQPAAKVQTGEPTTVSFTIDQPNGKPLTHYKRGPGPHTGIHLIIVRDDLSTIIHRHPPLGADGELTDTIVFPEPGPYRVVVDAYPNVPTSASGLPTAQSNFQLFSKIVVAGAYKPQQLPAFTPTTTAGGYRFRIHGRPRLRAIQSSLITISVTDPNGRRARFTPWLGALAHAIFFRTDTLDYFHTHVCAPGANGCTSILGAARVVGSSSTPGKLEVGVLLPVAGTWRLFLQCRVNGHILTAPFTLEVS
jgi:hypothetical protein